MAGQSSERSTRRWLSNGLTALAMSALGLAVAGSIALTTSAQPPNAPRADAPAVSFAPSAPGGEPSTKPTSKALRAFAPAQQPTEPGNAARRSPAVRAAVVRERAAQRDEKLAKAAEGATTVTRAAVTTARQSHLNESDQARNDAAAELVKESVRKAVAARMAAAQDRALAEQQSPLDPSTEPVPAGGAAVSPVPGAVIGAHFGQYGLWSRYHTGLDFRAAYGTPIKAVKAGVVLYAGNSGDWAGNHVAVKHADGTTTMYSHMSSMAATVGATVQAGQVIGYVGQTGRAFGAHLHFELYPAGVKYGDVYKAINPQAWLAANGVHTR